MSCAPRRLFLSLCGKTNTGRKTAERKADPFQGFVHAVPTVNFAFFFRKSGGKKTAERKADPHQGFVHAVPPISFAFVQEGRPKNGCTLSHLLFAVCKHTNRVFFFRGKDEPKFYLIRRVSNTFFNPTFARACLKNNPENNEEGVRPPERRDVTK